MTRHLNSISTSWRVRILTHEFFTHCDLENASPIFDVADILRSSVFWFENNSFSICVTNFPCSPLFSHNSFCPSQPPQPCSGQMQYGNCSIVLKNLWEEQKRSRNRVQWWRWLGNQIHSSASKGTGSLCSAVLIDQSGLLLVLFLLAWTLAPKWRGNYTASILLSNNSALCFSTHFLCCLV